VTADHKLTASQLWQLASEVDRHNRTAQRLGEILAATEKKKRMRRFTWCRDHAAVADDLRWKLVARMAGAPLHLVEAFQRRLDLFGNANNPRGSLEGFSIPALAAHWALPGDEVLGRIYAAMEDPQVGWIDQEHLVTFFERNPDVEDPTAAERMRRMRERRRAAQAAATAAAASFPPAGAVTRNNRNVTARSDQNRTKGPAVDNFGDRPPSGASGTAAGSGEAAGLGAAAPPGTTDAAATAARWLETEGLRIVIERMNETRTLAATRLARWRDQGLGGDAAALAAVLKAADATDYVGARFHNLVVDGIKRAPRPGPSQAALPMPPVPVAERKLG
jgi:hypothetical protein